MGPGLPGPLIEPAFVVQAFLDPFEEDCRAPVSGPDLRRCSRQRVVHAGLFRGNSFSPVIWVGVLGLLGFPELLRNSEFEMGQRGGARPGGLLCHFACELVCLFVAGGATVSFDPMDLGRPSSVDKHVADHLVDTLG